MGNKVGASQTKPFQQQVETRVGKLPLAGRYHTLPRMVTDDYDISPTVLGSGYNGVVRLGTRKGGSSTLKFAIKRLKFADAAAATKAQLEAEVEIFLAMDHPHITRLVDVYESEHYLFMVMECMEGGELFDRVKEVKRFSEVDAADAMWQMLLSLNYIHTHGVVHCDIKLENYLYDVQGGSHLKLCDFGFSKILNPENKVHITDGTLPYFAPEVLSQNYGSPRDLWSLGVIGFVLLAGYFPFSGPLPMQARRILHGSYEMKPDVWSNVSKEGIHFTKSLLEVNPDKRLTAQAALDHPWITNRHTGSGPPKEVDQPIVDALRQFGQASKLRRCVVHMMAWSLSNEERASVRQHFVALDKDQQGTVSLTELKAVLVEKFHVSEKETLQIFQALDSTNKKEIHYSDFLAAMVSTQITMHDDLLHATFNKFDTHKSGYITADDLKQVVGKTFEGESVKKLVAEGDDNKDHRISYAEFVSYIRGEPLQKHLEAPTEKADTQKISWFSRRIMKGHKNLKLKSVLGDCAQGVLGVLKDEKSSRTYGKLWWPLTTVFWATGCSPVI